MSTIDDLRASKAQEWLSTLETVMPADGHFGPDVLEAAGELPIVANPHIAVGDTPEAHAERVWADRIGARSFFKAFAASVVTARLNGKISLRRTLVGSGVTGPHLESVEHEESYWRSVAGWLEDFKP